MFYHRYLELYLDSYHFCNLQVACAFSLLYFHLLAFSKKINHFTNKNWLIILLKTLTFSSCIRSWRTRLRCSCSRCYHRGCSMVYSRASTNTNIRIIVAIVICVRHCLDSIFPRLSHQSFILSLVCVFPASVEDLKWLVKENSSASN